MRNQLISLHTKLLELPFWCFFDNLASYFEFIPRCPVKQDFRYTPTPMNRDPPEADKSPLRSDKLDAGNALAVQFKFKERRITNELLSHNHKTGKR